MTTLEYDPGFYDIIAPGSQASAGVVVPLVLADHPAQRVVDVGCGQGWWGAEFAAHGCEVLGVDGDWVPSPAVELHRHDLAESLPSLGTFDLAVCLEVAEHLPEARAEALVEWLCDLAPVVLFSAAIPGQPGAGHVNCQWPSWWHELFARHGRFLADPYREKIWDDERVEPWYRQNLLVATAEQCPGPADLVHPIIRGWL
jgi:SAM-dependent methyltransferase